VSFLEQGRDELWPGRPVLFTSYTAAVPDRVAALPQAAGLTFTWGVDIALQTLRTIIPDLRTMAVVGGSAPIERQRQTRDLEEIRRQGLTALDLSSRPLAETLSTVAHLPEHSAVMIAGGQIDGNGHLMPTWPLCEMISKAANAPTVMLGSQFLGCGIVGGLMRDFQKIGAIIGERAIEGLAAPRHGNETVSFARVAALRFDERQLRRWRIDERRLPTGSVVEFREPNVWRDYRTEIAIVAVAMAIQSILIAGLLNERRRRKRAEGESRHNLAIATEALRRAAMTALTGSIAHELSQPLSAILYNAEAATRLIALKRETPEQLQEILGDIRREDARATQIIHRHRAMLKPHALNGRLLDAHAVVREGLALVRHEAEERAVLIDDRLSPGRCPITGDDVLLQQVVVNLLMNAMDAMADTPPPRRRVQISSAIGPSGVSISVRDAGCGIATDLGDLLFDPFVTTKPDGLGIGLSIVRHIIDAHGGTIDARNTADGGAIFCFTLPCNAAVAAEVASA
jgi:signal transduction histidine kinase